MSNILNLIQQNSSSMKTFVSIKPIVKNIAFSLAIVLTLLTCSKDGNIIPEPTVFELLNGKWKIILVEQYNPNAEGFVTEMVEPNYSGIINIVINDTLVRYEDDIINGELEPNGFIEYYGVDRYGYAPLEYAKSPLYLLPIQEEYNGSLDSEQITFRDFSLNTDHYYWPTHYIKEINESRLILVIAGFPYWQDLVYEKIKD